MHENQYYLTPKAIVDILDKYIVGQNKAKKNVAIALRNRWRRIQLDTEIQKDIIPNNILMIGATGVGKTEIAKRLAKIANAPFVKVEASKYTEVGYVGRDVESMVRDLVENAMHIVKTKHKKNIKKKAMQNVENIILDALVPPIIQDQKINQEDEKVNNEKTRQQFRVKIRSGDLDNKKIHIKIASKQQKSGFGMIGGGMMNESSLIHLQDMLSGMLPQKERKKKVTIAEAKKLLIEQESTKLIDMDKVKEEAIEKSQSMGIVFIDEIDKIAEKFAKKGGPNVSREGVQRDLLPIVEGSAVHTKYGTVNTDHILFIAAGAFHVAKPSDLIPELQGRFPIRVELDNLTQKDFYRILQEPKNALIKQYQLLFEAENVHIHFEEEALKAIAKIAFEINENIENIGARRLHTVMSHLLNDFLFDVPDMIKAKSKITINQPFVIEKLQKLAQCKDTSEYIL